jgi:hypothetical protein
MEGGGEREPDKNSFTRNWPMSHVRNTKTPLKEIDEEH